MKQEEHSFIRETIKERPMSKRKKLNITLAIAGAGALFGLMACLAFYAIAPWAQTHLHREDNVVIQPDEQSAGDSGDNSTPEEPVHDALTAEHYREMMRSVSSLASDVNRSLAVITGSNPNMTLEENLSSDTTHSVCGLLVAETGNYLLFLIPTKGMTDFSTYTMSFGVGSSCEGKLRSYDGNFDLGIVEVPKNELDSSLTSYYRVALLGNSYAAEKGSPLLVMGNPFGIQDSIAFGVLSSKKAASNVADADPSMLVCDVAGSSDASGVFANLQGEILGVIMPGQSPRGSNALTAYSISDIKKIIERLSNRTRIPYVGIYGTAIDAATAEAHELEEGLYITNVKTDSPAMEAGIQIGDIIQSVNGVPITSMDNFHDQLMSMAAGSDISIKGKRVAPGGLESLHVTVTTGALQ